MYGFSQIKSALFLICVCLCLSAFDISGQGLPTAKPKSVGMSAERLAQIDALVEQDIKDKKLPGAVVLIGHRGKIVFRKAYGNRSLVPNVEPMTIDTIFDLASLTKVVATTTCVMKLIEDGKLRLNDTIGKYISDIDDPAAKSVTIGQLLTHTSGYAPDFDLKEKWTGREGMLAALKKEKLRTPPGTKFVYSDIGFIVLGEIVQRISGESEHIFFSRISKRFLTNDTLFFPFDPGDKMVDQYSAKQTLALGGRFDRIAPTEDVRGQGNYLGATFDGTETQGSEIVRGRVHDPTAFRMGGVAGHAGLFSTADDLARFCQMLLNGGVAPEQVSTGSGSDRVPRKQLRKDRAAIAPGSDGTRILSAQTVAMMMRPVVVSEDGAARGLGWDINTGFSSNRGDLFPLGSFGHTGFTGTSIWIDPTTKTFVVFLSNRVHPNGKGDVTPLRAKIATSAAAAVEDTPFAVVGNAESNYAARIGAQIPAFIEYKRRVDGNSPEPIRVPITAAVLNGIDVLARDGFRQLEGKRIGLVTNQTGRSLNGTPTIDILFGAKNITLAALFAPEHGIRGELDQENISDDKDAKTGLPIYSLYGETRRPTPEQIANIDAFVYDIQDVGTRFYTYTATLKNILEEAAKAHKKVYILDRPDPINGINAEGPTADADKLSFIAAHTVPVRYGLTIGELGLMMNSELKIGADLEVVKMEGWRRVMWFDQTGQTWVNPSPNMRSLTQATLYPGIGLLETTNVSVGRGTDTPFEVVGAPWIDDRKLAAYLNSRSIKGVRFVPVDFTPKASVFKGEKCSGINIIITDRSAFNSFMTGIEVAAALRKLFPETWQPAKFSRLLVNDDAFSALLSGADPKEIEALARSGKDEFNSRKAPYLLYK
ncbi:MAG: DUF1343 domain-containing protein [Chloracidobacterium sp.]|nr:DUF1343 domain-containing protein [Chloracidobacterium sp.]